VCKREKRVAQQKKTRVVRFGRDISLFRVSLLAGVISLGIKPKKRVPKLNYIAQIYYLLLEML
jgi:hypothetical protein